MSESEFAQKALLPAGIDLQGKLEMTPVQRHEIEKFIQKRAEESTDYKYNSREVAIAKTALADLTAANRTGVLAGLGTWGLSFFLIHRKTGLGNTLARRRVLHFMCFFISAGAYHAFFNPEHVKYAEIANKLNNRVSADFNRMMNLRPNPK